jgi:hypothetical protein
LIVVAGIRLDGLSVWEGSAVAAASVLPAWLTYRLVENPIRLARPLVRIPSRALALGAACTVAAVAVGFGLQTQVTSVPGSVLASGNGPVGSTSFSRVVSGPLGAEMLAKDPLGDPRGAPLDRVAAIVPDPLNARRDLPAVYAQGCHVDFRHSEAKSCVFGDPSSTTNVVIVGDSHAAQWIPALQQIAVARHWKLTSYTKSSCAWSAGPARLNGRAYPSCDAWNRSVATAIRLAHPTLVLTSSIAARESEQQTTEFVRGVRAAWAPLLADGIPVVVLKDTPHPGIDIAECASEHRTTLTRCAVPRSVAAIGIGDIQEAAVAGQRGVHLISLTDAICPTDECAAVIGSTLVYRDTNHVTATYMQTLAPRLEQALLTYST